MRSFLIRLLACLLVAVFVSNCASDRDRRRRRRRLPVNLEEGKGDEGIKKLNAKLSELDAKIEAQAYDDAEDVLEELEEMLEEADTAVITHPDYRGIMLEVRSGRRRIADERQEQKSDKLLARLERKVEATERLYADIESVGPTKKWLDRLDDLIEDLEELKREAKPHSLELGVGEVLQRIDQAIAAREESLPRYKWWLEAKKAIAEPLRRAENAERDATSHVDYDVQIKKNETAAEAFAECAKAAAGLTSIWGFAEEQPLDTPWGQLNAGELQQACQQRHEAAVGRKSTILWKGATQKLTDRVSTALRDVERAKEPAAILAANEAAAKVLADCMNGLREAEAEDGFDPEARFDGVMGKKSAPQLRDGCVKVRRNLIDIQPTLRWRVDVVKAKAAVDAVRKGLDESKASTQLDDRIEGFEKASKGFAVCVESAGTLAALASPHASAKPKRAELKGMKALAKSCNGEKAYAEKLLKKARADKEGKPSGGKKKRKR